jgi:hypothetical protein
MWEMFTNQYLEKGFSAMIGLDCCNINYVSCLDFSGKRQELTTIEQQIVDAIQQGIFKYILIVQVKDHRYLVKMNIRN